MIATNQQFIAAVYHHLLMAYVGVEIKKNFQDHNNRKEQIKRYLFTISFPPIPLFTSYSSRVVPQETMVFRLFGFGPGTMPSLSVWKWMCERLWAPESVISRFIIVFSSLGKRSLKRNQVYDCYGDHMRMVASDDRIGVERKPFLWAKRPHR